jgi:hypothetical protein
MRGSWANISKNRLIFVAIVFLTFCAVWIGYGLLESGKYEQQAQNKNREYSEYTRDKVAEACVRITKTDKIKCLNEAFEAKREYEYNQSDLVAQKQSALWAYIMAAAAVIGMALSAVGVWLVKTTFDETREANIIAREIGQAQVRSYLTIKHVYIEITESHLPEFGFTVANYGQSPALQFKPGYKIEYAHLTMASSADITQTSGVCGEQVNIPTTNDFVIAPIVIKECVNDKLRRAFFNEEPLSIRLLLRLEWQDVFNEKHMTEEVFARLCVDALEVGQRYDMLPSQDIVTMIKNVSPVGQT